MKKMIGLIVFVILLIICGKYYDLKSLIEPDFFRQYFDQHFIIGSLVYILAFIIGNILTIPGWPFLAAVVLILGKGIGGALTYVAAVVSCMVSLYFAQGFSKDGIRKFEDYKWVKKMLNRLDGRPFQSMFLLRVIFQTSPALNYTLALSNVDRRIYLLTAILGLPFPIILYCFFFDYIYKMINMG